MWINDDQDDDWIYKLKKLYWSIVPYDWRPLEIWYRLKCFVWHRYTTVHPKTLPWHTWTDRCVLLPHCIFQILTDFIDKECSPGVIDWDSSGHTILVDGVKKNVRVEMQDLYDWWKKSQNGPAKWSEIYDADLRAEYEANFDEQEKLSRSGFRPEERGFYCFYTEYDSPEDEYICNKLLKRNIEISKLDHELLIKNMQRVCALQPYLWT